jgi:hypothetical protein
MDVSKEKQLANEMADYCRKLTNMAIIHKKPWKNIIMHVVIVALAGNAARPDGWSDIPR